MGIRIIRDRDKALEQEKAHLKKQEWEKATIIWRNLTTHNSLDSKQFLNHFEKILSQGLKASDTDHAAKEVSDEIKLSKANIVTVQGNLELNRIADMIADLSDAIQP